MNPLVTIEEVQERIIELEIAKVKKRPEYRFEWSVEYIQGLIDANYKILHLLRDQRQ